MLPESILNNYVDDDLNRVNKEVLYSSFQSLLIQAYCLGYNRCLSLNTCKSKGEWIDVNGDGSLWKCSNCGETSCCRGKYCSDCGAKMEN